MYKLKTHHIYNALWRRIQKYQKLYNSQVLIFNSRYFKTLLLIFCSSLMNDFLKYFYFLCSEYAWIYVYLIFYRCIQQIPLRKCDGTNGSCLVSADVFLKTVIFSIHLGCMGLTLILGILVFKHRKAKVSFISILPFSIHISNFKSICFIMRISFRCGYALFLSKIPD